MKKNHCEKTTYCLSGLLRPFMAAIAVFMANEVNAGQGNVRQLPVAVSAKTPVGVEGKDYRLRSVVALNSSGKQLADVPAWSVDVRDSYKPAEHWFPDNLMRIPAFKTDIPVSLRRQITLYYFGGWIAVPRSWHLLSAGISFDSTTGVVFVSRVGADAGWLSQTDVNACSGCMYEEVDGLIPGAHKVLQDEFDETLANPTLSPKPTSMIHPDSCTAIFSYKSKSTLPVHAAAVMHLWLKNHTADYAGTLYVAMPEKQTALAKFILGNYLAALPSCKSDINYDSSSK